MKILLFKGKKTIKEPKLSPCSNSNHGTLKFFLVEILKLLTMMQPRFYHVLSYKCSSLGMNALTYLSSSDRAFNASSRSFLRFSSSSISLW